MRRKLTGLTAVLLVLVPFAAQAAPFDVEAATRAYLDTLQGAARAKSDAYFEGGYWLVLWGALVSLLADGLLLGFRFTAKLRSMAESRFKRPFAIIWLTALSYGLAGWLLTLPWSIYTGFLREAQYGLMNQTLAEWFIDALKGLGISLVVAPLIMAAIYAVIRRFPKNWWLLGTGLVTAFGAFAMLLAPVYVAPLFNTYTEMPTGPVRDRIVAMATSRAIPAEHIYVFDASKQTKRISANVSGIGPTIRISLNDNLLNRSTPQEVAAVMGHEMGHYKLNHVWWGLLFLTCLAAAAFFLISRIAPRLIARHGPRWGIRDLADPASLPVLGILITLFGLIATPLQNTMIRVDESQADAFGLDVAQEPDAFASVAMKLSEYRKIEPTTLEEMLFFDHPSGATRVRMSMQWKKDHVPNAQMVVPPPMPQGDLKEK
ncbi:MAG: M48 family metallopeptidase [Novosphingobium sp.]|uniref:M48 family metallopeptidase n=1 Tax=Novosphingobium sp. TaxID=1874826 RepID=UPI003C7E0A5B